MDILQISRSGYRPAETEQSVEYPTSAVGISTPTYQRPHRTAVSAKFGFECRF
jgi:hypothetical protein